MKYFFNNHIENEQLYLYSGGYDPTDPGHTYGPTVRSGYMIHYIYKGKGTFTCEGKAYTLSEGNFFFIEPDIEIKYEADQKDPWTFYWIGFRGALVKDYLQRTIISRRNPIFTEVDSAEIKDIIGEIIEISFIHQDNDLLLNAKLLEILYHLTTVFPVTDELTQNSKKSNLFVEAFQFIRNNYEQNIRISELAQRMSVDRTYLHRIFMNEIDMGPKEYLTKVRIRKAQDLLRQSELPIKTISVSVGYENPQQFARVFKQETGFSPREYRSAR